MLAIVVYEPDLSLSLTIALIETTCRLANERIISQTEAQFFKRSGNVRNLHK